MGLRPAWKRGHISPFRAGGSSQATLCCHILGQLCYIQGVAPEEAERRWSPRFRVIPVENGFESRTTLGQTFARLPAPTSTCALVSRCVVVESASPRLLLSHDELRELDVIVGPEDPSV